MLLEYGRQVWRKECLAAQVIVVVQVFRVEREPNA